jgi:hypothetical protein
MYFYSNCFRLTGLGCIDEESETGMFGVGAEPIGIGGGLAFIAK